MKPLSPAVAAAALLTWVSGISAQGVAPAQAAPPAPRVAPAQAPAARPAAAQPAPAQAPAAAAQPGGVAADLLTDRPEDEKAVRAMLTAFVEAYNAQKADAMGALMDDGAVLIDAEGAETIGRDAILAEYAAAFAGGPTDKFQGTIDGFRFLGSDTASVRGDFQLVDEEGNPSAGGRYGVTVVRGADKAWKIAELRDHAVRAASGGSNYPYLAPLEWMVGEWVDESEGIKLTTTVKWMDEGRNFLVRTFEAEVGGEKGSTGTQYIGYDPRAQQIRSWVFDSEGGFGEGYWSESDGTWFIHATGVTRDGQVTSAMQSIAPVNKDSVRLSAVDRIVGGEAQPDIPEVIMVRKPPAPAGAPGGQ